LPAASRVAGKNVQEEANLEPKTARLFEDNVLKWRLIGK